MSVALVECSGSAGVDAAGAHGFHEVAHVEAGFDVFFAVEAAAWAEGDGVFVDDFGGEWDVAGDD